jgi:hypothetical protein
MRVSVYSREAIEHIIAEGSFPDNTAVISFCNSELKHIDKDYSHVDYSSVCSDVFYCEVDDLDLDYLTKKGYTYETYFPEADDLAKFIVKAVSENKNIVCQCEYGQSRSAGCAAAIKEYFYKDGISVFADYNYYPNQVVFHKVYDALVKINSAYCNTYHSSKATGVETLLLKQSLEKDDCYHSLEEAYFRLRHGIAKVNVSLHIDDAKRICHGPRMGEHNIYVETTFKYSNKDILLTVFIPKITTYIKPNNHDYYLGAAQKSLAFTGRGSLSFDIIGIMELDCKEPVINRAIITNIKAVPERNSHNSK